MCCALPHPAAWATSGSNIGQTLPLLGEPGQREVPSGFRLESASANQLELDLQIEPRRCGDLGIPWYVVVLLPVLVLRAGSVPVAALGYVSLDDLTPLRTPTFLARDVIGDLPDPPGPSTGAWPSTDIRSLGCRVRHVCLRIHCRPNMDTPPPDRPSDAPTRRSGRAAPPRARRLRRRRTPGASHPGSARSRCRRPRPGSDASRGGPRARCPTARARRSASR